MGVFALHSGNAGSRSIFVVYTEVCKGVLTEIAKTGCVARHIQEVASLPDPAHPQDPVLFIYILVPTRSK